jgi:hypothetical protein
MLDTGRNVPESFETLKSQQKVLIEGRRTVQMFPTGTPELELPDGKQRYVNGRGIFHYNPRFMTEDLIELFSSKGQENVLLMLGPFSKDEIVQRVMMGEQALTVTEYTPSGVELRCALGTVNTASLQRLYFEATKEPDGIIIVGGFPARVHHLLKE